MGFFRCVFDAKNTRFILPPIVGYNAASIRLLDAESSAFMKFIATLLFCEHWAKTILTVDKDFAHLVVTYPEFVFQNLQVFVEPFS